MFQSEIFKSGSIFSHHIHHYEEDDRNGSQIKCCDRLLNGFTGADVFFILKLKVKDVKYLKPNDTLKIREQKTGKQNVLMVNKTTYKILKEYLEEQNPNEEDYLFKSRKGDNKHLTVSSTNLLVKNWCKSINLQGNYGTHSLRETFGYIQREKFGVGIEILMKRFNHSSQYVTQRYLGIDDKEVNGILMNEI